MPEKCAARWQQFHSLLRALEERSAQLVLEVLDLAAQRRLTHVQAASGLGHCSLFGDGNEVLELREAHAPRLAKNLLATNAE